MRKIAMLLIVFVIASCGTYSERTIQTTISSDPPGASIYVDGEYQGIAPLKLRYKIDESKYNYLTPGRVVARWRSGATASRSPKIRTNKSVHTVLLKRPSNVAGLDKDLAYVREREEALEEAEMRKEIAREYARQARSDVQSRAQINCGLEMMRTGRLPSANCANPVAKTTVAPVYTSAITVGGADLCPREPSLGRYSHSTRKGMNKICYYR